MSGMITPEVTTAEADVAAARRLRIEVFTDEQGIGSERPARSAHRRRRCKRLGFVQLGSLNVELSQGCHASLFGARASYNQFEWPSSNQKPDGQESVSPSVFAATHGGHSSLKKTVDPTGISRLAAGGRYGKHPGLPRTLCVPVDWNCDAWQTVVLWSSKQLASRVESAYGRDVAARDQG